MRSVIQVGLILIFSTFGLSACGGGGGDSGGDDGGGGDIVDPPVADTALTWDQDNWDEKDWQ